MLGLSFLISYSLVDMLLGLAYGNYSKLHYQQSKMLAESRNMSEFDKIESLEDRNQVTVIFIFLNSI